MLEKVPLQIWINLLKRGTEWFLSLNVSNNLLVCLTVDRTLNHTKINLISLNYQNLIGSWYHAGIFESKSLEAEPCACLFSFSTLIESETLHCIAQSWITEFHKKFLANDCIDCMLYMVAKTLKARIVWVWFFFSRFAKKNFGTQTILTGGDRQLVKRWSN